ncbi:class I SAM-dependent methyltransferase [Dietzia sp. 179-F 9C3 NHS]|uniref:class I SAM-dependent methyltransferase n=1 Tax=Dietzia sp. 179-F 9C3 NHS TaxID=3374295 RepID=UPI00387A4194
MADATRWNHNLHYHRHVLDRVPAHARSALDVGTGDGLLAGDLRSVVPEVSAIDLDETVLDLARRSHHDVSWIHGDVLTHDIGRRFDVVASIATLHHLGDPGEALSRLADLTAPGGVLVVIGLARPTTVRDHLHGVVGAIQHRWYSARRGYWQHSAPVVEAPPHSYDEVRATAAATLPGVRWRHLPLWRYRLVWSKPSRPVRA